ncbi:MAG: alpha/beta hydrolase [Alphaproteobacteria bacterium]
MVGLLKLVAVVGLGYLALMAVMYLAQRKLQYFPDRNPPGDPAAVGLKDMQSVKVITSDNLQLVAWFAPPKKRTGKIVIIYHGNAGNISNRAIKAAHFMERGHGVFMCEYRGYGGNPGTPTEEGFYIDARAAIKWLEDKGYTTGQFVIYGESIGTGVAVQMATEIHPRQMILEAPFSSATDVARRSYGFIPVDMLILDRFDSLAKIPKIKTSLFIIHGDEDAVIPIDLSKKLFELANHPKEFITIERGGHSDLYNHHAGHVIGDWLDKQVSEERA